MTRAAWQWAIWEWYAAILFCLLCLVGLLLAVLRWGFHKNVQSIFPTYRSWLLIVPVTLAAVALGRIPTILLLTLVSIGGFKELARATGLYRDWVMTSAVYLMILATGACAVVNDPSVYEHGWYGLFMTLPAYAVALFFLIPVMRNRVNGQLQNVALAITGYIYIGWMFLHVAFLADAPLYSCYLLYLLVAVELNDVAAFTFGRLFGRAKRHLLRSAISPGKTWEGAAGGLGVSMALPWILRFSLPDFSPLQLVLTGLIVGVGGQLGDLSISVVKRDLGIKDMGAALPGHGGILDRIDSLIYTALLFFHMIDFFHQYWW